MKKLIIGIICLAFAAASHMSASDFASPIYPGIDKSNKYLGIVFGIGQNMQNGTANVQCDTCSFSDGIGTGFTVGLSYEQQFTNDEDTYLNHFKFGAMLLYNTKSIEASFRENEVKFYQQYNMEIPVWMRNTAEMSISSAELMPYFTYNPIPFAFIRLGFNASYLLTHHITHTKELIDRTKILPNGEKVDITIDTVTKSNKKIYSQVVQDGDMQDINKLQLALQPAIGFDINFSQQLLLSTSFNYSLPLTKISNDGDNFTVSQWRILLELKYNLTQNSKVYKK